MANQNRVMTGEVRFSYCHLDEPHAVEEGQTPKYSVSLIIPKTDTKTLKALEADYKKAIQKGVEKFGQAFSKSPAPFVRQAGSNSGLLIDADADDRYMDNADYKGCYILNPKATTAPTVYQWTAMGPTLINKEEIKDIVYSGCYGRALINCYPFNSKVNKGIACGLDSVIKTKDGESLGGHVNAMDYWGTLEADESGLGDDFDPFN